MVLKRPASAPTKQRNGINKLTLGFASLAAATIIGATGFAAAATPSKPTKAQCAQMGYTNYGQCVSDWAKHKQKGNGYGGNTANVTLNVEQSGSNNVMSIILNLFQ